MKTKENHVKNLVMAALCFALTMLLPMLTGNIPTIGSALLPMHFPVLICGFICGWKYGAVVGFAAPLVRSLLLTMPPMLVAISMAFELAAYGAMTGILYRLLPKKPLSIYISLIASMLGGRVIWAISKVVLLGMGKTSFSFAIFLTDGFVNAIPGIIAQIVLIPIIIYALEKSGFLRHPATT